MNKANNAMWTQQMFDACERNNRRAQKYEPQESPAYQELDLDAKMLEMEQEEDGYIDVPFEVVRDPRVDWWGVCLRALLGLFLLISVGLGMAEPVIGSATGGSCIIWAAAYWFRGWLG